MGNRELISTKSFVLMWVISSLASAEYIFVDEPLARTSPALGEKDLFGYATALHRVDNSGAPNDFDAAIANTKIIVGAPSGTYPGGLLLTGINGSNAVNNTGLVYQCPILPGLCEAVTGNGTGNDIRLFDYQDNENTVNPFEPFNLLDIENKDGQFMGATVISTGNHIMVCAPRWISLDTSDDMYGPFDKTRAHGRCFIAGRDMTNFKLLRPCTMDASQSQDGQAYCMAGTSATIYEKSSDFSVFLGGPPYDESAGAVFRYDLEVNEVPSIFEFIPGQFTNRQFLFSGMAIAIGRIGSSNERDLLYSLPKNNFYSGSVQVYNLMTSTLGMEVNGKQMGEYFGWSLATADLNGDSFDEVIVGAPLYSTIDNIELGRVYIFKNNMGNVTSEEPIIITGSEMKGRFGSAIVNLGDINSDGFEDIAISAPFVDDGSGAEGSVYIYLGSGDDFIQQTAEQVQVITALQISQTLGLDTSNYLQSFGYSLSSGLDVDANFNNDLVIGGYKTQTVVVLRTYSIANVSLSLTTLPDELLDYTNRNCTFGLEMFACFDLEITASFSGRGLDGRSLDTMVSVRENAVSSGQRIFFEDSDGNRTDNFETFLNFTTTNDDITRPIKIYVENDVADIDRRTPLSVLVNVFSIERKQRSVDGSQDIIDLRDIPLLNILPQNDLEAQLTLDGCANTTCMPDLELTLVNITYLDSNEDVTDINNEIVAGEVSFIRVVLNYTTLGEDAVHTLLELVLPSHILESPRSIDSIGTTNGLATSQCPMVIGTENTFICRVQPIFSSYDGIFQVAILLRVASDLTGNELDDIATITITTDMGIDPNSSNNQVAIPLSVSAAANVRFDQLMVTPNSTQYEDTADFLSGTIITTIVTLINTGPSKITSSELRIYLPSKSERTGDYYYLYPTKNRSPGSVTCTGLNPDGLDINNEQEQGRRRKRQQREVRGERRKEVHKREIAETVNCGTDRSSCTPIECSISQFSADSMLSVTVFSVVDNRFFRTQSGDFELYIHATFEITSDYIDGNDIEMTSKMLLVQEPPQSNSNSIPIWVYILSGVAALLLLAVVILILYCVGFFKLRRKDKITKERELITSQAAGGGPAAATTAADSLDTKPEKEKEALNDELVTSPPEDAEKSSLKEPFSQETEL